MSGSSGASGSSGEDLISSALGALMANPQLLANLAPMLGKMMSGGTPQETAEEPAASDAPEPLDMQALLSMATKLKPLLSSLGGMEGLGSLLGNLKFPETIDGEFEPAKEQETVSEEPGADKGQETQAVFEGLGQLASLGGASGSGQKKGNAFAGKPPHNKQLALLVALKPYLSPNRAAAVDAMVRFGKLEELFGGLLTEEKRR